jgi:hypothetical protein
MTVNTVSNGIEVGIRRGLHRMLPEEAQETLRSGWTEVLNEVGPNGIEVGKVYCLQWLHRVGNHSIAFRVDRITPSGKFMDLTLFGRKYDQNREKTRVKSFLVGVRLHRMDADGELIWGTSHRAVVVEALARGLGGEIPLKVRAFYPGVFIEIPANFVVRKLVEGKDAAEERVKDLLDQMIRPNESGKILSPLEYLDRTVAEEIAARGELQSRFAVLATRSLKLSGDLAIMIRQHEDNIKFYRWMEQHFQPGGAFYGFPEGLDGQDQQDD